MEVWKILLSIILVLVVYTYRTYKKNLNYFIEKGVPSVGFVPYFGSIGPSILGTKCYGELMRDFYNSAPADARYTMFMNFIKPAIMVCDIELVNQITVKNFENFIDHQPLGDTELDPLFANFLPSMKGEKWHAMRSTLSPSFTTLKIKYMFQLIKQCADEFSEIVRSRCEDAPAYFNTKELFSKVATDIIVTTAFGVSVNSTKNPDNDFYSKGLFLTATGYFRTLKFYLARSQLCTKINRLLKFSIIPTKMRKFFLDVVGSNINQRKTQGVVRPDMIQLLMDAKFGPEKRDLTLDEITCQAVVFLFAGLDTVSTALSSTVYLLAKNPHIQEKLQAEIDRIYEETGGNVSYEDLQQFKYLDAVILEAMRLYPPFSHTDRVCTKRYELPPALPGLKPLVVEPGTTLFMSVLGIHQDPKYFPNPEEFIPERFIGESGQLKEPPGYLTFGRGPRLCIGNRFAMVEMKVVLFELLLKTSFKICDKTIHPTKFAHSIVQYNPLYPILLQMKSRKYEK